MENAPNACRLPDRKQYSLEFSNKHWEEISSLLPTGFDADDSGAFWRDQWIAIAHMALGKAARIASGAYGTVPEADEPPDWAETWIEDLEEIADTIFSEFQPGDGKL